MNDSNREFKIAILEDEDLLRGLLSEWLGAQSDLRVVGSYQNVADFRQALITDGQPIDLMIVDLVLPDGDGLSAAIDVINHAGTDIPVIVISGRPTGGLFDRLSRELNGGWAFLLKDSNGLASLRRAVDATLDGLVMLDPNLKTLFTGTGLNAQLTPIESQIMTLVSQGMSNSGIAGKVLVSEKTVERVLSNLYLKFGLTRVAKDENPRVRATLIFRGLVD